jgi:mycothiol maleylpyruvate isomerase-like protein
MNVDRGFVNENSRERSRLQALVARSSDADLARAMAAGWTVAAVLGHLAFWDQRILSLLDTWERTGALPTQTRSEDTDWINDAGKPFLLALPPRQVADLAVAIAQAVDGKIETLSDEFVAKNAAAGNPINLDRAEHRHEHLGDIEKTLK